MDILEHPEGRPWQILIIGLGSIASKHVQALHQLGARAELTALRSSPQASVVEGFHNIYALAELGGKPDFVLIANPTLQHRSTIEECLALDVPLFIEKPVLHTLEGSEPIKSRIAANSILTYVACNMRFLEALAFTEKYVREQQPRINEVNAYCGSYLPDWRPGRDFRAIYSAQAEMGGGVHLDLVHELDYLYWMFGAPNQVSKTLRSVSSLEISAIDYANYVLTYPGFTASVVLNYYRRDRRRTLELVMEHDTWLIDIASNSVSSALNGPIFQSRQTVLDTYIAQMQYFLGCLVSKQDSFNTFTTGTEVLSICLSHDSPER